MGGLGGPVVGRPALGCVGEVSGQVRYAELVSGELAEAGVVIEGIPVMHRDPGERVEHPEGVEAVQAPTTEP